MTDADLKKLQALSKLLMKVQKLGPDGEHFCSVRFGPTLTWGEIEAFLFWKCEHLHLEFKNLDEAVELATGLVWCATARGNRIPRLSK